MIFSFSMSISGQPLILLSTDIRHPLSNSGVQQWNDQRSVFWSGNQYMCAQMLNFSLQNSEFVGSEHQWCLKMTPLHTCCCARWWQLCSVSLCMTWLCHAGTGSLLLYVGYLICSVANVWFLCVFSVIFGTPYRPQPPCHSCLKVVNTPSFCVFLGDRQCKISLFDGEWSSAQKRGKMQIVCTESGRGKLTHYKSKENIDLQDP